MAARTMAKTPPGGHFRLAEGLASAILDNGLRIFVREHHDAPVASVQAWIRTGSVHEGDHLGCGLSHFLEHMLFQGSAKYPGNKVAATVHRHGGEMNAYTSYGCTVYHIDILAEAVPVALDILADMVTAPRFPAAVFRTEKEVILRERAMVRDQPDRVLSEHLWQTLFTLHPMRHPIIGYADGIASVDRAMMAAYHRDRYTPGRCLFIVSGDVQADAVIATLRERLSSWPRGRVAEPDLPTEPPQRCARRVSLTYPDPLARLALACQIPEITHPDTPALTLLAAVLGQGKSSTLVRELQDRRDLAIQIHAHAYASYFTGVFGVGAVARPESLPALKVAVAEEIDRLASTPVPQEELAKVIRQEVTAHVQALESNQEVARIIGGAVLNYGDPGYIDRALDDLRAVTPADLQRVAAAYLGESSRCVVEMLPEPEPGKPTAARRARRAAAPPAPTPELARLPAGTRLVSLPDARLPLVDIAVVLPGGTLWEGREKAGLTRLAASLLNAGAGPWSEADLAERLESNAVHVQASSGNHTLTVQLSCHRDNLQPGIEALTAMLAEPTFPEREFERNRQNQLSGLRSRRLHPVRAAEECLLQLLYGDHPYSCPAIGREETVAAFTRDQARRHYRETCLHPGMAVIGIVGDLPRSQMADLAADLAATIPWRSPEPLPLPPPHRFPADARRGCATVPREQAVVMVAIPACGQTDPDRHALGILQTACGGMDSRLFRTIRDREGLAYFTGLFSLLGWQEGILAFYAGTRPDAVDRVIGLIDQERRRLARHGLTAEETASAIARQREDLADQRLHRGELILQSALGEFYGHGFRDPWDMEDVLRAMTRAEANRVVRRFLSSDATVTVVAGPAAS
jgi:zinc protease